jgi:hypothetical protein
MHFSAETRDESWETCLSTSSASGLEVVELLIARRKGNPQLYSATLIVTDPWGALVCQLPFSAAIQSAFRVLGVLH